MTEIDKEKEFNLIERLQKSVEKPDGQSGVDLIMQREKEMREKGQEVPKEPPTFKFDGYEFPLDFTVVALCCFAAMKDKKVNKIMKAANIKLFDLKGRKYFPKEKWLKRILKKWIDEE